MGVAHRYVVFAFQANGAQSNIFIFTTNVHNPICSSFRRTCTIQFARLLGERAQSNKFVFQANGAQYYLLAFQVNVHDPFYYFSGILTNGGAGFTPRFLK